VKVTKNISQPQDKFVIANGLKLHYLDWGNPDAVPIVLLHGLCGNAHYWDFFARNVASEHHLLTIDQRGHGDSDRAENYGPRDYVLDLEAFVDSLKLSEFVLTGHSLGGINAIIYAARHPTQVSALVIVDIGPEIAVTGIERMEKERAREPDSFGSEREAIQYMKQLEPRHSEAFVQHQARYALKRDDRGKLIFKYDRALRSTELQSPQWLWEYLKEVICPTLLLHGMESDILSRETAQKEADTLLFGSVVDIEHAGHNIPGDNPDAFEVAVRNFMSSSLETNKGNESQAV
jgi:pimeloyl-ACP methyl ester carboxylesterase